MSAAAHFFASAREYPFFWGYAALSFACGLVELGIVVSAVVQLARQRACGAQAARGNWKPIASLAVPSRAPEIVAGILPLVTAALYGAAIQGARTLLAAAADSADPAEKHRLMARAFSAEGIATLAGLWSFAAVGGLACLAVGLAVGARHRGRGLNRAAVLARDAAQSAEVWRRYPGPNPIALAASLAAFFVLGFAPVIDGGIRAAALRADGATAIAGATGAGHARALDGNLDRARAILDARLATARIGVVVAAVLAGALAWLLSPERARGRLVGPLAARGSLKDTRNTLIFALAAFFVAAAALIGTRPLRRTALTGARTRPPARM